MASGSARNKDWRREQAIALIDPQRVIWRFYVSYHLCMDSNPTASPLPPQIANGSSLSATSMDGSCPHFQMRSVRRKEWDTPVLVVSFSSALQMPFTRCIGSMLMQLRELLANLGARIAIAPATKLVNDSMLLSPRQIFKPKQRIGSNCRSGQLQGQTCGTTSCL